MLWIILCLVLCSAVAIAADAPVFLEIPVCRDGGDGVFGDVLSHSVEPPFSREHGRPTCAHETAHGIHATYRNKHTSSNRPVNCLYMGDGKIAVIEEPEFLIRHVQRHIPMPLRGYRYPLYFVEQLKYWDEQPLYIYDEWAAYICGGETAVDDHKRGIGRTDEDSVSGCLEFGVYAIATYLTALERDPDHDPQLKAVLAFNLVRAEAAFSAGRNVFKNTKQEEFYEALQSHPDAAPIRDCLRNEFDGAFLEQGSAK